MSANDLKEIEAMRLVDSGLQAQQQGDLDTAIKLYRASINVCPTAEGYTYLGWALNMQGEVDSAIENCREAIAIDPDFGNPYNDIGVYLMQREELDAAIPWLEKAKEAPRYEPRHFPYINLGQIYLQRGEVIRAIEEFEGALRIQPDDERIRAAVATLRAKLN